MTSRKGFTFLVLAVALLSSGCRNALEPGLGDRVDIAPPTVRLLDPTPGSFLSGTVTLSGTAKDDQAIDTVEISFDQGQSWTPVTSHTASSGIWQYELNTTATPDGRLLATVRATDTSGKTTVSDEIVYNIDNTPPVVLVTSPQSYADLVFNTRSVLTVTAADRYTITRFGAVVEESTDGGATWGQVKVQQVDQSTTWTMVFESEEYTENDPQMLFRFFVWAEDEAGNRSTEFYHVDHLRTVENQSWTADLLLSWLSSSSSADAVRAVRILQNPQDSAYQLVLAFDEDGDIPQIDWISPQAAEDGGIPTTRSRSLLSGIFRDDDGIDLDSMRLRIERGVDVGEPDEDWDEVFDWTTLTLETPPSDIRNVGWDYRLPDVLGQGYFRAHLEVSDIDGTLSRPFTQVFIISDGNPSIEVDTPENIYFSDRFTVNGTASHSIPLTGVRVDIGYGSATSPTWVFENRSADYDPATTVWEYSSDELASDGLDLSALPDGNVRVRARAVVGSDSEARQVTLVKDTVAADVVINTPESGAYLNRTAVIRGSSIDALSGVGSVAMRIDGLAGDAWIEFGEGYTLAANGYEWDGIATNWTFRFDSEQFAEGPLTAQVRATDRAGNESQVERGFEVNQDSDLPVVEISNMDVTGGKYDNVLSGDPQLIGSITDDDAVDPGTFRYRVATGPDTWTDWRYVYAPGQRDPTPRLDFNIPLMDPANPAQFLGDGSHRLQIWVDDIDGIGLTRQGWDDGGGLIIEFSVDKGPPTISISEPATGLITNQEFTLSGEVTDGFGVSRIDVSFDGGTTYLPALYEFDQNGDEPQLNVPYSLVVTVGPDGDLQDGTHNVRVRARDLSGSVATENVTVTVDTENPTISFIRPEDGQTVNSTVLIQGAANDNLQMQAVYWYITPAAQAPPTNVADWTAFATRYSWEYTWDTYAYQQDPAGPQGDFEQADYDFHVQAVDSAGNWSGVATLMLTVDQESDRPRIEVSNVSVDGSGLPDPVGTVPDNVFGSDAVITGTVQDDDGVQGDGLEYRTRTYDWDTGTWGAWSAAESGDWTPVTTTFSGTRTNATWSQPVSQLGDGVHEIEFRVRDIRFDPDRGFIDDNFNWNTTTKSSPGSTPISFAINTTAPAVAIASPESGRYLNSTFTLTGTASDPNGLVGGSVRIRMHGQEWEDAIPVAVVDGNWDHEIELTAEIVARGLNDIAVRAVDRLGRETTREFTFTADTTAPVLTVALPIQGDWLGGSAVAIQGTASDDRSGVAEVRFWAGVRDTAPPEVSEWTVATGALDWNGSVNLGVLGEGRKSVHVRARDIAGNWSEAVVREFGVDQASPDLTETAIGTSSAGRNVEFSLGGQATDSNELSSIVVTQRRGEGVVVEIYRDDSLALTSFGWTVTGLPRDPDAADPTIPTSNVDDGLYRYVITATDAAGKSTSVERLVRVDLVGPEVVIASPTPAASVQGTAILASGTAVDVEEVSPIREVRYWVGAAGAEPPADYAGWNEADGGSSWSATLNFPELVGPGEEGDLTLHVIAQDTADNWGEAVATVNFTLDQNPPTITGFVFGEVNTVGGANYAAGTFNFSFDLADTNALASYTVTRNGTPLAGHDTVAITGTSQQITVSETVGGMDGLDDGDYEYVIMVYDVVNKQATLTRSVVVDTTAPDAEVTSLRPTVDDGVTVRVNGTIEFTVAAGDASGLLGVRWWMIPDGGALPAAFDDAGGTPFGASPYRATQDTAALDDETIHTLVVIARDRALNDTIVTETVLVDQSSDFPTVTFTDLDPQIGSAAELQAALAAGDRDNLLELNARVRGVIADDDRVDSSTIEISLNAADEFVPVSSRGASGRSVSFSHSLAAVPDAVHFFYLRFSDDPDAKLGTEPPRRTTTVGPIYFVIDTENPSAAFTGPAVNSYQRDGFMVSGTASDASGITSVEVSVASGAYVPVTDTSGENPAFATWEHSVDITELLDAPITLRVRARDAFDKTTVIDRQVTLDREAPLVTIAEPLGGSTVNAGVRIRGTTTDNFEIDAVYRWIGEPGVPVPSPVTEIGQWTAFDTRYSWEYLWDTYEYQQTVQGTFDAQEYVIHIAARDGAGNWSAIEAVTVTVDQTSNRPVIGVSSIDEEGSAVENLLPTNLRINGTVEDDDAVDRLSIQVRVETLAGAEVFGWTGISGAPSGNSPFVTWSHTFSGATGTALPDGQYRLYVRAFDITDPGTYEEFTSSETGPIAFAVDLANPEGSITAPAQGSYVNTNAIVITGTASDANGVDSVTIRVQSGAEQDAVDESGPGDPFSSWSFTHDASAAADGQIMVQITITDAYDKVTTIDRTFILDREAPEVFFTQPSAGSVVNGSLLVRGTTEDEFTVASVAYAVRRVSVPADAVPQYPADYTPLSGTFSWDFRVNTTLLDDGEYRIYVVAADAAGNTTAGAPATLDLEFDQSTNLPEITISNASDEQGTPTLFGTGGAILGTITDDDGVDIASIEISFDDGATWQPISSPPSSGGVSVNFSHSLDSVTERAAPYTVRVRASDTGETQHGVDPVQSISEPVYIGVDRNNPEVTLTTLDIVDPYDGDDRLGVAYSAGMLVLDDFTLRGTATDASGIASLTVSIDGGTAQPATVDAGQWSYAVGVTRTPGSDGPMTITVQAVDGWGRTTTMTYNVVIDTTEPLVTFTEPSFASSVNGEVTLRGTTSDANAITALGLELGRYDEGFTPVQLENSGTVLSWRAVVDSNDYANNTDATGGAGVETEPGSNVWLVPFVVTATDAAGNRTSEEQQLRVDPDSDRPIVAITGPADGTSVSTEFVLQGTVTDDDPPPLRVALVADSNDDGTYDVDLGEITGITTGSWSRIIDTTDTGVFPITPSGYIRLRAVPFDASGTQGDAAEVRIFVDTRAPVSSISSPMNGSIVRGEVVIEGAFRDDQDLATNQMRISFDGGNTYGAISGQPGATIIGPVMDGDEYVYSFTVPIDTANLEPATGVVDGNGILQIAVRVTDATFKQSTTFLELSADNTRPSLELNYNATMEFVGSGESIIYTFDGNADAGGNYIVIGSATDEGVVSGIERVDLYFVKSGAFLGVREGVTPLAETTGQVHDQDGVARTIPYRVPQPRADDGVLEDDYVVSIDNRSERGVYDTDPVDGDADGFQESLRTIGAIDEWYVYFDTTVLPDGPFDLYAVVYDLAGNASYVTASAQAANYPPSIPSVSVGAQTINATQNQAKVRDTVNVVINATDSGTNAGIDVATFRLAVEEKRLIGGDGSIGSKVAFTPFFYGSIADGAIADFDTRTPGTGSAESASAEKLIDTTTLESGHWYLFVAEARDIDGNTTTRSFYVWVNNADITPPSVTLDDFTQESVTGLPGHLEEATELPPAAAALSGTVRLTGTVYDDTAVDSVTLEISYDDGGTWSQIGQTTEFGDPISGDVISGYTYEWSYEWNTSGIIGMAREGLVVRAYGSDGTNLTNELDRPTQNIDVVPYITGLRTGLDSGLRSLVKRSALGRYPVAVGSEVTVDGYNLGGPGSIVTVGGTPATVTAGSPASLSVDLGVIETSGNVVVTVNGVDNRNHLNDNTLPQNREPDTYNETLTDDRYLAFWRQESHSATSYQGVVDAAMHPDPTRTDFDWVFARNGRELWHSRGGEASPLKLTDGLTLSGGDFTFNEDGSLVFLYNHNNGWYPGDTRYEYAGSVQLGLFPSAIDRAAYTYDADDDAAYNWHANAGLPKAGLGNQSFDGFPAGWEEYSAYSGLDINRYKNLRVIAAGTDATTRNYVAYFDTGAGSSRNIVFWNFKMGTTKAGVDGSGSYYQRRTAAAGSATITTTYGTWYADVDRYFNQNNDGGRYALSGNADNNNFGIATPRGRQEITPSNSIANSEYFDLGIHEVGPTTHHAFIAYYDGSGEGSLKITANEGVYTADPLVAGTWSVAQTIDTSAGAHVAMAVDPDGGIHLAYQDTQSSYLKYAYLTYTAGVGFSVQKQVYVDALIGAGLYNSITVRDFSELQDGSDIRPVITTYSSAFAGTNVALRTSYPLHGPGDMDFGAGASAITGRFTGKWETVAVVGSTNPLGVRSFTFTNGVELNEGRIHVGYNGSYLEENTYLGE